MKRLILLRHAKTEPWHEGIDDHGRALTDRGHQDARHVAEALRQRGFVPTCALVSTARRARETWSVAAPILSAARVELADDLYLASPDMIEDVIARGEATDTLIVVGHNPGLYDLACRLLRRGGSLDEEAANRLWEKFPTGCAAVFEAETDVPLSGGRFRLVALLRPRDLGGGRAA